MSTILDQIIETKREEVEAARTARPLDTLKAAMRDLPPPRDFRAAVSRPSPRGVRLIAEIKRRSPSAGLIRPDFDPTELARIYHQHGADALSVLTDEPWFDGRLAYLDQVRAAVPLPVLRKDFMIDPWQIYESRAAGADAILLIGEALPTDLLKEMLEMACELGMTSLIEVHEDETLARIQDEIGFPNRWRSLLGINNRNLKIQRTDLSTTARLAGRVADGTVIVAESGIQTREDVQRLIQAGAHALLIGETFMRAPDIGGKMAELLGPPA